VVETAVAFAIPRGVHATQVWDVIQAQVRAILLAGKDESIWLVVAMDGDDHRAVAGAAPAARVAHELAVPCRVYDTRSVVREAKRRFESKSKAVRQRGVVRPLRAEDTG
jgi:hypothetical protein